MAVLPSPDSATDPPCSASPIAPLPTSFGPCWLHTPELLVKTHAAPVLLLSSATPAMAVLPSAETATTVPMGPPLTLEPISSTC